ncbi:hypothetical protein ABS767_06175 [Sphingomonas sp. ST-64]|uniref:Uncharacterized protein n=1 Tax=Sphingomonas plantiphila TaxID=3163295 RepID=A0ABW8YMR7_9SPHN
MTDGRIFLALSGLMCLGVFLNGVRFARMTRNPWAGMKLFGQDVQGSDLSVERVRLLGWLQAIAAPLIFVFFAALAFGLLGPVEGIETIQL